MRVARMGGLDRVEHVGSRLSADLDLMVPGHRVIRRPDLAPARSVVIENGDAGDLLVPSFSI